MRHFEDKARWAFYIVIGIIWFLGGWILALVCFIGWIVPFSMFVAFRSIALYGGNNWGTGLEPHDPVTPKEMWKK